MEGRRAVGPQQHFVHVAGGAISGPHTALKAGRERSFGKSRITNRGEISCPFQKRETKTRASPGFLGISRMRMPCTNVTGVAWESSAIYACAAGVDPGCQYPLCRSVEWHMPVRPTGSVRPRPMTIPVRVATRLARPGAHREDSSRMPTSPKSEYERKRRVVAGGILQGKKTAVIAREAGCGPRHVRTLRAEEATQVLISDLLRPHIENLR